MADYRIRFPVENDCQIKKLKVGDSVTIDGIIIGIRDASLIRMFDDQQAPGIELRGAACLHTAPGVRKVGSSYEKVCIGTTTSTRMSRFTRPLMKDYGVKAIIGKAGLSEDSLAAMREYCGCYLAITGGAAALETTQIEEIEEVLWLDLMPECIWKFRVKNFGPLIVAMDSHGNNLYQQIKKKAHKRLAGIFKQKAGRKEN